MKAKKYILSALLILLSAAGIISYFSDNQYKPIDRDFEQIESEGVLRVVTDYNSSGYYVDQDSIAGFNAELIQLLQQYTPIHIEIFTEGQIEKLRKGLLDGKYDLVATDTPLTTELRDSLEFTEPILFDRLVLVQRKQQYNNDKVPIRSQLDLANETIYVQKNSSAILRVKNLSREIGDTIYYVEDPLYSSEQLAIKVASGEIDFAVCNEKSVHKLSKALPEVDFETYIGFTHLEAWAVRPNSPILRDSLNCWLKKIKDTDKYKSLLIRYYKQER